MDGEKCFVLADSRDATKNVDLCILPEMLTPDESFEEAKHKWLYDIAFFRDNCKEKDRYVEDPATGEVLEDEPDPIIQIHMEAIEEEKEEEQLERIKIKDETQREVSIQ